MGELTHTPGPWESYERQSGWIEINAYPNGPGQRIPVAGSVSSPLDAALIVAAPEMLEALRQAKVFLSCLPDTGGVEGIVRDAIARAEGRAPEPRTEDDK